MWKGMMTIRFCHENIQNRLWPPATDCTSGRLLLLLRQLLLLLLLVVAPCY